MKNINSIHRARPAVPGFTIIELLGVIVVIAILSAITLISYNGIQLNARKSRVATQLVQIRNVMEIYKTENNVWPFEDTVRQCIAGTLNSSVCRSATDQTPQGYINSALYDYLSQNDVPSGSTHLGFYGWSSTPFTGLSSDNAIQFCFGVNVSGTQSVGSNTSYYISSEKPGISPYGDSAWCTQ